MQGHLGGHWFPSIGFNHPFQFLGTITFKFLLEPSLSDWVRTEKSGEERIWLMESQGPQQHWRRQHQGWGQREGGGGRSGGEQQQYCSGAAMGSAPDLVVYGYFLFWLWSFVVFKLFGLKFLLVLFWTWSMCFFFLPCLLVGLSLEVPEHRYRLFNIGFPRAVFLGSASWDTVPDPWITFSAIFIQFIFPLNSIHFLDLSCQ